jgi:hypothetical protein
LSKPTIVLISATTTATQREGCGHPEAERAEQFPAHALGEALRQNLAHLRFERSEVAVVRVEEDADDAPRLPRILSSKRWMRSSP